MKIVNFKADGGTRLGFLQGERIVDPLLALETGAPERSAFSDTVAFIRSGETGSPRA